MQLLNLKDHEIINSVREGCGECYRKFLDC